MVLNIVRKNLGFVLQPSEGGGPENPVAVAMVLRAVLKGCTLHMLTEPVPQRLPSLCGTQSVLRQMLEFLLLKSLSVLLALGH